MEFNLADLFEKMADTVPDRTALVAGDVRLTYAQLDERATRLAHHLIEAGVRPGDHVGVYAFNRAEWVEAFFGCFKARAVPINVNYRYVVEELRYLFDNADLVALIYEAEFTPHVAALAPDLPKLRHYVVLDDETGTSIEGVDAVRYEDALGSASPVRDFAPRSPDDQYVLYTGGTTGMPKGVMWRGEDIFFAALGGGNFGGEPIATPEELGERAAAEPMRLLALAPLMHGNAQWTSCMALFGGNTVVLCTDRRFHPDAIWDLVEREQVTSISLVGDAMARPLVDALADRAAPSSLMAVSSGGAILSPAVKSALREHLPNAFVLDAFGASETGANGTVDFTENGPRFRMNDSTLVLSDELRPVAPGETGLLARTGHVPLGYYKDAEKTAATFPTVDGKRYAVPGDRATLEADGTITLLGRGSQSINSGGEKIFPEEVESALKSHPAVFDALVVGVPDERFGERVCAVVQFRPGHDATLDALAEHCRGHVAGYKVPRALVPCDDVRRQPSGKPDYRWAKSFALDALA